MSGYGYGPPPPPPPPPPPSSSGYGHSNASYSSQGQSRGGSGGSQGSRGRGGQYPRARDYHAPPVAHYDYASQPYPNHHASYGATHPPVAAYPPHTSQWGADHISHAPHGTHGHVPAPPASNNYHPNYAPPPFPPAGQNPQPSPYGPGQPYGQSYQGHAASHSTHWSPQGPPQSSHHSGNRSRTGYGDRGGYKPPHSAGPSRHGYDPEPMHSAPSYGQPFLHDPRAIHYAPPPSFPYAGPPATSLMPQPENHFGHQSRRGRGSNHRDGARGRGGHHNTSSHHGKSRNNNNNHSKPNQKENKVKVEPPLGGKKKKRKVNTLGLTPGADSETEDDEGEEKVLTELIGTETLQISDVSAFLAERRKNYPTKARVDAKKAAQAAQKGQNETTDLEKQADRLRKQLAKVEFSIKRKREQGDEGDDMRDPVANPSDDEKPEVMSSRVKPATSSAAPAKKADVSRHCKYYSTGGTCGKKGKCRFVHDPEVRKAAIKEREANNGRMTIQQRLILNDKEQEDLAVLQSIQYIRRKGLIEEASENGTPGGQEKVTSSQGNRQDQNSVKPAPATSSGSSVLPAAPASLPAPPPKKKPNKKSGKKANKKPCPPSQTGSASLVVSSADSASTEEVKPYEGWLLQPYGSSNGDKPKEG
ncbi:hypothetical protein E4U43_003306 [Claviceps pusilla]|uniref:C3H1-type domain-containing protein n=1 Tax=Claviceps pusilla TaxID=123648 RepID=A0A9P7SUN0_9HYPO|nr:hypothetical protein E4U43_003306 [Claviceps pusilla]